MIGDFTRERRVQERFYVFTEHAPYPISYSYILYNIDGLSKHLAVGYPQTRAEKSKLIRDQTKTNLVSESEYIPMLKRK
jgi:hypothetical protein